MSRKREDDRVGLSRETKSGRVGLGRKGGASKVYMGRERQKLTGLDLVDEEVLVGYG